MTLFQESVNFLKNFSERGSTVCGIIGVIGGDPPKQVESGLRVMNHRGVRSGFAYGQGWAIGHRRLPIVGVGVGNDQPVRWGKWTVGFVGEILDFRDYDPGAECDIDLVARTWTNSGPKGFTRFDGFWSVVAAHETGDLHALVDYLSQKPLYVRDDTYARAIASEPDAIASLGPLALDWIYLSAVAKWGYCPEPWRTPYVGVRKMVGGEHVILHAGGGSTWATTDPLIPIVGTERDLYSQIDAAIRKRVTSSDVPIASLVSGGLDSAIVYTFARRYGDPRAYHVENGERENADRVAPGATILTCDDVPIGKGLTYMQEPIDLGSLLPQVALSDAIARTGGESVCLTGDGADEFFGGYRRAVRYDSQLTDVWHELQSWHLPRLDRVMMRNRIEVRSPFLARRVAGLALGSPYSRRIGKMGLRDLFRKDLPPGIADIPKRPLRTESVQEDREGRSLDLINQFVLRHKEAQ